LFSPPDEVGVLEATLNELVTGQLAVPIDVQLAKDLLGSFGGRILIRKSWLKVNPNERELD
jgi:hypothetical protein